MSVLYAFPPQSVFNKAVPKSKIYSHGASNKRIKELFVKQVEKIVWTHKLSANTVNLPASKDVQEIQVLEIVLKTGELSDQVLKAIDKSIPSPILFLITHAGKCRYCAAYKRMNEADNRKWVLSDYYSTDWFSEEEEKSPLPVVLSLKALYDELIKNIIPLTPNKGEGIEALIHRNERIRFLIREHLIIENQIKNEKQFNKKVELNRKYQNIKQELDSLRS